ncbi:hypothetical protein [Streptococcus gallolyticus]|uniref:hypothetical protein n=1 Tax=Streptococcus gallolyticus TaxID=315405 RepID=UPI0022853238|nr:hypothetical protein [Streptococcus gallolyticus]MCY7166146.1 hypothetical protein [Streptococcus gallolyticus subsp. gallolyticus]MCY7183244.1 hypothetical protein [Streptococcus gallolyticus subsp. gallolyticus]
MYRLTNQTQNTTTTYKNRDLVLRAIERENARVKHLEAEGLLLAEELDKKGVVIYQEDIFLPFDGITDSLFLKPNTTTSPEPSKKEKRKRSEVKNDQEPRSKEKQGLRKPVSDTTFKSETLSKSGSLIKTIGRWGAGLIIVVSLTLAGLSTTLVFSQVKQVARLSQQVTQLENLQSQTGKLDTFMRYFLPYYYSEQGDLSDFVSSKLDLRHQSGQLQSVILETTSQTGDKTYQLTYILAIKDGDNRSQKRLEATVKEQKQATYGYQIIKVPKLTDYPN